MEGWNLGVIACQEHGETRGRKSKENERERPRACEEAGRHGQKRRVHRCWVARMGLGYSWREQRAEWCVQGYGPVDGDGDVGLQGRVLGSTAPCPSLRQASRLPCRASSRASPPSEGARRSERKMNLMMKKRPNL